MRVLILTVCILLTSTLANAQCVTTKELYWLLGKDLSQINRFMELRHFTLFDSHEYEHISAPSELTYKNESGQSIYLEYASKASRVIFAIYQFEPNTLCYKQVRTELNSKAFAKDGDFLVRGTVIAAYSNNDYGVSLSSPSASKNKSYYSAIVQTKEDYSFWLENTKKSN